MPEVSGDLITRNYSNFRGVDFSNTEVALYRSPDAINMWKDYKKMGTSIETRPDIVLFKELKNTVYGLFFYTINQVDHMIIHCGVSLYDYNMKTKELKIIKEKGMNIRKSQSFIYRNILYIKDGLNYLQYDGETCKEVIGYIPITTIGKAPSGGGTTNQEVNLLTGVRENSFCADGESTEYVLDASELDAGYQEKVFINDVEKTEGFTVDKVSGKVKFTTAPEKPLTDGQDNVVIRFSKTIPGNRDKINKCTILEVFDNRVFFSGNQDYPNTVFHTMLDEPKYCSDLDYYNEGADISPVRGMVAGNNALWVIKEPSQANTAIFYHNPTIDSEAGKVYPSEHSSISTGCIGAAINFNDDIVYFSNRGMEGISGDITTEQVISHRSSLVDSKLLQEENYKDMILVEYEGYLLVIIKDKIYLADSRAMFTNENHNEYEWFYWNIDIEPTCAVVYNGELWLGSKQGIFKIGKASENNKEISMEKDEEERYFIDGVTKQETGVESYKTATGKEILIEDGENNKGLEIKVKGSTTQATRSGKNLFDENQLLQAEGWTYSNGYYNGLVEKYYAAFRYGFNFNTPFKENTQYTIKLNAYTTGGNPRFKIEYTDGTNYMMNFTATTPTDYSYTTKNGKTISKIVGDFGTGGGQTLYLKDLQLEQGTTATDYEPYGASPSPDYPSEIENVEGKNKFNYKKLTPTFNINGNEKEFTITAPNVGTTVYEYTGFKTSKQYTLSGFYSSTSLNGVFRIKYSDNTYTVIKAIYDGSALSKTKFSVTSTVNKTIVSIQFILYGNTYDLTFYDFQIEEGTVATPYVPYNSLEFKVEGKNKLKGLSTPLTDSDYWYSVSSNYFEALEDGWGKFSYDNTSGTSTVFINSQVKLNAINLKPNTQYTIITEFRDSTVSENANIFFTVTSGNATDVWQAAKTVGYSYINQGKIVKLTATTKEDFTGITTGLATYLRLGAGASGTVEARISVIEGDYDTTDFEYEPYKSQVVTFPLGEEKLMEGSYLADDGIHHKRKQVVFDGSENWKGYSELGNVVSAYFIMSGVKKQGIILCDRLKHSLYYEIDEEGIVSTPYQTSMIVVKLNKARLSSQNINGIKTWLSKNPITVEYDLAEPETVPFTAEQQEALDKKESMKLYDGVNHIESTSEIDIKYNYIYKKPSIKNKSNIENKISSGEYQTIINNKRYFVFLEEELKSVRNDITDRLYIDTNKNIAKVMKRVDKLVLNGTEEWNVNATHSNVFYTAKPKNMADNETNIFCTITDEFSKDLSGETYGILIDTNINIKIPKVKTVADLKAYLAKEPITIQYKAIEEIKDIILLSKPSSYWTTCEDEFKYPQMQKTTNKRGCVADVIGEEIDVFCKTNKEQFEKIATHKNATGYAVNRIKKKKWKSIQLKFSSNKSFELFSCTLESYIGSYIKR